MTAPRPDELSRAKLKQAETRLRAWTRILECWAEMRDGIAQRIHLERPDDRLLAHDVQTLCEMGQALADYQKAKQI